MEIPRPESGDPPLARHPWLGFGLVGGIILSGLTMTRLAVVKSRRIAAEMVDNVPRPPSFSWEEILVIGAKMFAVGFGCGLIVRASRRLSIRYGAVGDVLLGVIVLNLLLAMCLIVFDPEVLGKGWRILLPLFGIASALGAGGGFFAGREIRKEIVLASKEKGQKPDLME